ncbi:MAG: PspA/IM30 family protein, partial [Alphaproteobacteria bacterium]|nr:PspA/IM30 family protein [Alphaproteobacteria bacterium]
ALAEKREDLAEAGVGKLLDIEAQIPVLESAIGETREAQIELEGYVAALRGRKAEMKEELREFRASQKEAAASGGGDGSGPQGSDTERRVERASEAFDRAMEIGGGIGGGDAPDRKSAAANAELEQLARKNRVNERLARFKDQG